MTDSDIRTETNGQGLDGEVDVSFALSRKVISEENQRAMWIFVPDGQRPAGTILVFIRSIVSSMFLNVMLEGSMHGRG